jgi:hypothetical protein
MELTVTKVVELINQGRDRGGTTVKTQITSAKK